MSTISPYSFVAQLEPITALAPQSKECECQSPKP